MLKTGTLNVSKRKPIEHAGLFQHFLNHNNKNAFDEGEKEDWSFWSFQLIDCSYNELKVLENPSGNTG